MPHPEIGQVALVLTEDDAFVGVLVADPDAPPLTERVVPMIAMRMGTIAANTIIASTSVKPERLSKRRIISPPAL